MQRASSNSHLSHENKGSISVSDSQQNKLVEEINTAIAINHIESAPIGSLDELISLHFRSKPLHNNYIFGINYFPTNMGTRERVCH